MQEHEPRSEPNQPPAVAPHEQPAPQPESDVASSQGKRKSGRPRLAIPPEDEQKLRKREQNDRYYQKHGDKILEQNKRYQKEHRGERTLYRRARRRRIYEQRETELRQSAPQPESDIAPPQVKRKRGRPRLSIPSDDKKRRQEQEHQARYYQKNQAKLVEYSKRYQKEHREERAQYLRNYRKRKREEPEAEVKQAQSDQHTETLQIFP